jgi:hypothetical protein
LGQVKAFLDGTTEVTFRAPKAKRKAFIERVLTQIGYAHIPQYCVGLVDTFCADFLNPYDVATLVSNYLQTFANNENWFTV